MKKATKAVDELVGKLSGLSRQELDALMGRVMDELVAKIEAQARPAVRRPRGARLH